MAKRLFTADPHFGHSRMEIYCPGRLVLGKDIMTRDKAMIKLWNEKVDKEDTVEVLGDFAMTVDLARIKWILSELNGTKNLIVGNHDTFPWADYVRAGFASVQRYKFINIKGVGPVGLTHDPTGCITAPDIPWLVGHLHQQFVRMGNAINVGVDVRDYAPVSEEELKEDFRVTKIHMRIDPLVKREILGVE